MWKNNMANIARVGALTAPQFRNMPTLDLGGAFDNYVNARDKSMADARRQAYVDELTQAHPEAAAQIAADPAAYMKMLNDKEAAERDQQYKMEQLQKQYDLAMARDANQHAYSMKLQNAANELRNQQAAAEQEARIAAIEDAHNSGRMKDEDYYKAIDAAKMGEKLYEIAYGKPAEGTSKTTDNVFEKKRVENIAKNMDANIQNSQKVLNQYKQAGNLLNNIETGGLLGKAKESAWDALLSADEQKFRALANEVLPTMRPAGSGSTSDKDMAVFERATFGLGKNKAANESIIKGRIAAEENAIAYQQFLADGYNQGIALNELDKMWNKYLNENNIFNDDGSLNKNRKTAEQYFYGNKPINTNNATNDGVIDASEYFK
jgi:hypothetical protein